jgi:hypothetical protein
MKYGWDQPTTPDTNCNNFVPRRPITANDTSIERQQQGLHVPRVGFLIAPAVTEIEATRAEATQNYKNTHTPHIRILAVNQST